MAQQDIYYVNAFASEPFQGNPAAVCPLQKWLDKELMQKIASETGLTCAYFVGSKGEYQIRWFTPSAEISGICGHGTLAAAAVITEELGDNSNQINFEASAGHLQIGRVKGSYLFELPSLEPCPVPPIGNIATILGLEPETVIGALDLVAVLPSEEDVADFRPNLALMTELPKRALIVTAEGKEVDFVSRWFGPKQGEGEDTGITGSAHCTLVPYWANRLSKTELTARQLSPRGGDIRCELRAGRVLLQCSARIYMRGELLL